MGNARYEIEKSKNTENGGSHDARLLYVASSTYEGDWASIAHTHYFCELFYVRKGNGSFYVDGKSFPVTQDDIVIVNPNVEHTEVSVGVQPLEYIVLGVDNLLFDFQGELSGHAVCNLRSQREETLFFFDSMLKENEILEAGSEEICQALLKVLIIRLSRITTNSFSVVDEQRSTKECGRIKRYIDANYSFDITLEALAEMAHLSKYYLIHSFVRCYGMSPISYLSEVRIKTCMGLLESTDYSIGQIAQSAGFSSQSYFSQTFRKAMGQTPIAYRKARRK